MVQAKDGYLDAYYMPSSEIKADLPGLASSTGDGDGFGIRGLAAPSPYFGLTVELQSATIEDDLDLDQLRFGIRGQTSIGLGLAVEYVNVDLGGDDADGPALHARFEGSPGDSALSLFGQVGYMSLGSDTDDFSGLEFSAGLAYRIASRISLFADYRRTALDGEDTNLELTLSDWRLGARLHF